MATLQRRLNAPVVKAAFDAYLAKTAVSGGKTIRENCENLIFDASVTSYNAFATALGLTSNAGVPSGAPSGTNALDTNHRIIIVASDGTVFYDSSKRTNTSANVGLISITDGKPVIGDNHMTRPEIMTAALNHLGVGTSVRLSNTTKKQSQYITYRVGSSSEEPKGFIRYSIEDAVAQTQA